MSTRAFLVAVAIAAVGACGQNARSPDEEPPPGANDVGPPPAIAKDGEHVRLRSGTYHGDLVITGNDVVVEGDEGLGHRTTIDGRLVVRSKHVSIRGVLVKSATEIDNGGASSARATDASTIAVQVGEMLDHMTKLAETTATAVSDIDRDGKVPTNLAGDLGAKSMERDVLAFKGLAAGSLPEAARLDIVNLTYLLARIDDRRNAIMTRQSERQPPLNITHAVLVGQKDPSGNPIALLATLTKPIAFGFGNGNTQGVQLPREVEVLDPITHSKIVASALKVGSLDKPGAIYVVPKSVAASCLDPVQEQGRLLSSLHTDILAAQSGGREVLQRLAKH